MNVINNIEQLFNCSSDIKIPLYSYVAHTLVLGSGQLTINKQSASISGSTLSKIKIIEITHFILESVIHSKAADSPAFTERYADPHRKPDHDSAVNGAKHAFLCQHCRKPLNDKNVKTRIHNADEIYALLWVLHEFSLENP